MDREVLDLDDVLRRIQGDQELLIELVEIFLEDCPQKLKTAETLIQKKDHGQLSEVAHSLKGAASNISAKKLWKTFLSMEEGSKAQQDFASLSRLCAKAWEEFKELQSSFPKFKEELL